MTPPSPEHPLRLYKREKLCNEIAIGHLFTRSVAGVEAALAYPLRVVWKVNDTRRDTCPKFLVSIPKKRLRHAVDRVQMRRRVREAYRLSRHLIPADVPLDIAFIYVAKELKPYSDVSRSVTRLLGRIAASLQKDEPQQPL